MQDLFSIEGKVALVTGGSRGIGLMIARGYVEAGARVYVASRKAEVCQEVAAELSQLGTCHALPADLSSESAANRLATELGEQGLVALPLSELSIRARGRGLLLGFALPRPDEIAPAAERLAAAVRAHAPR